MKIAISGYGGFLGSAFTGANPDYEYINLGRKLLYGDTGELTGMIGDADVVINLAGASIWRLWTAKNRRKIIRSREEVNRNLVRAVNGVKGPRPVFISASATHIYTEDGGFLNEVARRWEAPLNQLDGDVRKVILRMAVVLGTNGGAIWTLRTIGKFGFTGIMGTGKQYFSFIHLEDWVRAVRFILDEEMEGIYDLSTPHPVDYATFAKTFARAAGIPIRIRIPVPLLKITLGETRTIVTDSQYVIPEGLVRAGFRFRYPDIESVMKNLFS